MGVQGLWTVVAPTARPVQLESLRDRKLAVDASIWIHQFMRTMRSEDGSVLRNGHVLGFFRRICKLLFYNIKPVFVFDGGAPTLKRSTIKERRQRRQGIQANIKRTAEKILNAQLKSHLLSLEEKRHKAEAIGLSDENVNDTENGEDYVYLEELQNDAALSTLRHQNVIKQDQYQLPPLREEDIQQLGRLRKKDPRLATNQELADFINEFKPSDIDMDSSVFHALPTEIQYEIIQDLKLKSRQTSWARLESMIRQSKTALDFSKQQILQLKHRNEMTQRVLEMNDMANKPTDMVTPSRIASERGKAYILVKNENLEEGLGWRLPGVKSAQGASSKQTKSSSDAERQMMTRKAMDMHTNDVAIDIDEDDDNIFPGDGKDEDDPVARAVANNPALAALMGNVDDTLDDGEYPIEMDNVDIHSPHNEHYHIEQDNIDSDDTPLFNVELVRQQARSKDEVLLTDTEYDLAIDHEEVALNEILLKMYKDQHKQEQQNQQQSPQQLQQQEEEEQEQQEQQSQKVSPLPSASELEMDADSFYQLWLTRMPDAFIYMHSTNDEYKTLLKSAIFDTTSVTDIEQHMKSIVKSYGKSNNCDSLTHEAFSFYQRFLQHTLLWKKAQIEQQHILASFQQNQQQSTDLATSDQPHLTSNSSFTIDDVDDEDEDIQFIDSTWKQQEKPTSIDDKTVTYSDMPFLGSNSVTIDRHTLASTMLTDTKPLIQGSDNVTEKGTEQVQLENKQQVPTNQQREEEIQHASEEMDYVGTDITEHKDADQRESSDDAQEVVQDAATMMDTGYNSDEELTGQQMADENAEYARFVSDIASRDLGSVREEIENDMYQLNKEQHKQMGNADTVTNQMVQDIQELLQLFGVPYLVSPMEAEAQCSYLVEHNLVDGVVTDDSDVFLFGGTRVYKNMFHQQKYVECYLLQDISREMQLDRQKLIQLAYFLGSDYTNGIPGIGPVAALEILAAFQNEDDDNDNQSLEAPLIRFRQWYESGLDKTPFQKKFRREHKHLDIPDDFPNALVKEAYCHPMVDSSLEPFTWSPPQLDSLRIYLMRSFSWSEEKTDQVLIPVIREMNKRQASGVQTSISSYFDASAGLSASHSLPRRKHKSKRVQRVVNQLREKGQQASKMKGNDNNDNDVSSSDDGVALQTAKRQRKRT